MPENNFNNSRNNEMQLRISLKFHHSQILSEISLESAVSAMARVWMSCQNMPNATSKTDLKNKDETVIESVKNMNRVMYR